MAGSGREGPAIGATFAGYRIEALLGEGGMGVVYLARDERLDRPVALKLVAPRLSAEPGFRERFLIESRLAASLDHSHVVPIYEAGEVDGDLYLAMRYVEGTTLRDVLRHDGPLEPARALDICEQVAQALDGAHDRGLVHRDVKPANVLVADEGGREHCYLCDFGLARQTDAVRDDGRFSGTVAYTAPEQISGGSIDGRADQYALACVLCECLTGQPPFPRAPAAAILFAHLSDPPASLHDRRDDLPESIDAAVGRALAKEPDERYATCRELVAEARTALGLDGAALSRRALLFAAAEPRSGVAAAATIPAILLTRGNEAAAARPKPPCPARLGWSHSHRSRGRRSPSVVTCRRPRPDRIRRGLGVARRQGPEDRCRGSTLAASDRRRRDRHGREGRPGERSRSARGHSGSSSSTGETMVRRYDLGRGTGRTSISAVTSRISSLPTVRCGRCATKIVRVDIVSERVDRDARSRACRGSSSPLAKAPSGSSANKAVGAVPEWSRVWRIDPATNTLGPPIDLEGTVADLAVGEGAVWTLILEDDLVRRIDPVTFEVSEAFRVGRIPEALAAGEGAVWVAASRDGTVTRFDLSLADLKTIEVGGAPRDLATGGGAVWAAVEVV